MKKEAQIIALAKVCGWTECRIGSPGAGGCVERPGRPQGVPPGRKYRCDCPDYLNDLNAMHEAEKMLTEVQRMLYGEQLHRQMKWRFELDDDTQVCGLDIWDVVTITASQRAEAFLRTLNLWTE